MAGTTNIKQVAQLAGVSLGTVSNAALLLLEETEANSHYQHRHVVFQPELVIRESSNQPARVRRAIVKARRG